MPAAGELGGGLSSAVAQQRRRRRRWQWGGSAAQPDAWQLTALHMAELEKRTQAARRRNRQKQQWQRAQAHLAGCRAVQML